MKKLYTAAFLLALFSQADAQVLNQSAGWPNAAWTITGSYSNDPLAFEANPTTTANFAFDDDDAGSGGHEDNIAAESPVIDLTAAFDAGEKSLVITVDYGYYYLENDVLQFQYWDAQASAWMAWPGGNVAGNNTSVTNDFCTIPKETMTTGALSIAAFTPAQLTGFKYRIFYDDDTAGADWNYGFCFNSPTITSISCGAPVNLAAGNVTNNAADISWDAIAGVAGFEYVFNQDSADPTEAGTATTDLTYAATSLDASSVYYFHLRVNCGSSFSSWVTIEINTMADVPANDSCATAIAVTSFPYTFSQDASAATNNDGFIDVCAGMNDGVWFTFEGNGNDIVIDCTDVDGWDPELGVYSGSCGTFTCVDQIDDNGTGAGETLTISTVVGTTYYINFGHYSGSGDEPEGVYTINITEFQPPQPIANDACADAIVIDTFPYTNAQDATGATNNDGVITAGCSSDMNDGAWYTFTTNDTNQIEIVLSEVEGWDPQMDVYSGSCGTFTCVASADDGGTSGGETITFEAVGGVTYFINVGHYSGSADEAEGPYEITINATLGSKSFAGAGFKSHPNPVVDVLNVSYSKSINEVTVYNLLGQQVLAKSLNAKQGQIDLSSLNTGNYIVKLTSDNEVQTLKVLKQ